ncbi:MAG TPA: transcriptional repressor [Candidatus Omnitrophica bacterium]|nr:transcriptional repressor [Candidatus Omnitrophota bacterium]
MKAKKEEEIFADYASRKNLKHSGRRDAILKIFLKSEKHLTVDELFQLARKASPGIGYATIYRTLKHFCASGLCREFKCEDGFTRYEHLYGHEHHDHLICTQCGKFVEVVHPSIEKLQAQIAEREGFILTKHKLELYGVCKNCRKK